MKHYISFSDSFHVAVSGSNIVFFNDADSGPYIRGTITLHGNEGNYVRDRQWFWGSYGFLQERFVLKRGDVTTEAFTFMDLPGAYYRHFRFISPHSSILWTLMVSFLYPLLLFEVLLLGWAVLRVRRRHASLPPKDDRAGSG